MNTPSQPVKLTERERTVLELLAAGNMYWRIDAILQEDYPHSFSMATNAARKLCANTVEQAIAIAIRGGHIL